MEDDYNDGQFLQIKDKRNAGEHHEFNTTVKVGEAKEGKHALVLEEKLKMHYKEFGGGCLEVKMKNNGTLTFEDKCDYIQ
jgi:hypothetical protein